jgi:hypothetical protein
MNNKPELQEKDIIDQLKRWKQTESSYPEALKEKRRTAFLALIPAIPPLGKLPTPGKPSPGHLPPGADLPMTMSMKIVLGVLSTTILVLTTYVGNTLYRNWDAVVEYLNGTPTSISQSSPSLHPTASNLTTPLVSQSSTPVPTATPTLGASPTVGAGLASNGTPQPTSNPGNHYGQTKTPRPTKTPQP